jgi:hypothetical protein
LWSKNGKKALNLTGVVPLDNNKRASVAACHRIERNEIPIPKEQEQHDDNNNNNNNKKSRFAKSKINEKKNDDEHQSPDAGQAVCSGEWR